MIELKNVGHLSKAVGAISTFISEGNFRFNDNGVSLKAIDPSQIVLVNFRMPKASFEKFDLEPSFIGLDLVELNKIMQRSLPEDRLSLDLNDSEMRLLFFGELERSFNLPLIDVSEDEVTIPSAEFEAEITIKARILKEALKDASLFGSSVVLRVKEGSLSIEARGSQGTMKTLAKQTKNVEVRSNKEVVSKYSLNFFSNLLKEADPDSKVKLQLKTDAPMKVSYRLGNSEIEFHLAHMIL